MEGILREPRYTPQPQEDIRMDGWGGRYIGLGGPYSLPHLSPPTYTPTDPTRYTTIDIR